MTDSTTSPAIFTTLVSASAAMDAAATGRSVKFLDCRASLADPDEGRRAFEAGHIPGAGYLSLDDDLAATPGDGGRHPLPEPERLAERLRALGINDSDQVVVYDDSGGAFAARAWWCLRWLGHEAVAVLDGGLKAWPSPLTTARSNPPAGDFTIRPTLTRVIEADELVRNPAGYTLIDARTQARFEGREEPIDPVAGHIPGAHCRPFQENLDETMCFRPADALRARFENLPVAPATTVCYCGSGVTAAHNILAMKIAGYAEPLLYPGSWSEWIRSDERPREPAG
jgi:thiosulfate/3-mercaptopyruvate sulfurtransferase